MPRKQPFAFEEFKSIYSKVPRLCVDLFIETKEGVLLTLRNKNGWIGQWHFPGGTVHYKESLSDAAKRLAIEELGVNISVKKFIGYLEFPDEEKERGFGYTVSLVFLCKLESKNFEIDDQAETINFFITPPKNMIKEHKDLFKKFLIVEPLD